MYLVTNRRFDEAGGTLEEMFGGLLADPADDLRLARVTGAPGAFAVEVFDEKDADGSDANPWPSEVLFLELRDRMKDAKRSCVFFVHGYNTDIEEALETSWRIQELYGVEVILFSWPSDGELTEYRCDKRDAALSALALDRAFEKLASYVAKHIKTQADLCGQSFSLLVHSMGTYLLKFLLKSTAYQGETLLFDNVVLAAADVNHHDHVEWVDRLSVRNRVYVAINEDDRALAASRAKFGDRQLARLGHTVRGVKSTKAVYVDFTDAEDVGSGHSYFVDEDAVGNPAVRGAFHVMLHGGRVERDLPFDGDTQTYRVA